MNNPQENVKKLPLLKHFCITIGNLPSSYMESMSYEEMIIWLCKYLEETVIPTLNNNGEAVNELQELYKATKEYIDSYFTNLDVQKEINNKLDKMSQSGELTQLIKKYIQPIQENFENNINNKINNQNNLIEKQNNDINILKERMNEFSSLDDGSTTGDAELQDIRIGYNSFKYSTAGNSTRNQVKDLHNIIENNQIIINSLNNNIENGTINSSNGTNQNSSSRIRTTILFNVKKANLNIKIKDGYKVAFFGYNSNNINDYDKSYEYISNSQKYTKLTSNWVKFVIAKTNDEAFNISEYTDDILEITYLDKNQFNNIDINKAIIEQLSFLTPYYNLFDRQYFSTSEYKWLPTTTRIGCNHFIKLNSTQKIYAKENYQVNIAFFSDEDLSSYTSNSGWVTEYEIPANQIFQLSIKKVTTEDINTEESINIYTKIELETTKNTITPYKNEENSLISKVLSDKNSNTLTFGVITDTHNGNGEYYRNYNQAYAIDKLCEKIGVDFIIHLGDVIQGYGSTVEQNKLYLKEYWETQNNTYIPTLYSIGHHERYGKDGESSYDKDNTAISENDCVGICGLTNKYKNLIWSNSKSNFYFDTKDNVRVISLNSVSNTAKGFSTEAINFLQEALKEDNKKIIVFSHVPARKQLNAGNTTVVNGTQIENILNNYNGTVIAYIHGHTHWDNIYKPNNLKFPFYSICCALPIKLDLERYRCDEGNPTVYDRELNTYSQYCFDIFNVHTDTNIIKSFRFGAGKDRSYVPN